MEERYTVLIPKKVRGEDFHLLGSEFTVIEPESFNTEFSEEELLEVLPIVDAIVAVTTIDAKMIAKALSLKVIVANGAGFDNVDVTAATALKIPVINVPDATAQSTAELALALMLNVSRRVSELDRKIRDEPDAVSSLFETGINPGQNLFGKTLGIVGLGHIGLALAAFCWPLRMNIQYTNRHRLPLAAEKGISYTSFHELIRTSDIISIHCPLNDETRNMFNEEVFRGMKSGAILINTARGAIVDNDAMIRALRDGRLKGAGIDVYPNEPEIPAGLTQFGNVILTPHIGTNTVETRKAMVVAIAEVIRQVCSTSVTQPLPHTVNAEIYTRPVPPQPDPQDRQDDTESDAFIEKK